MSRGILFIIILIAAIIITVIVVYTLVLRPRYQGTIDPIKELTEGKPKTIEIWCPAFEYGSKIPVEYTCDGEDISIPLRINDIPEDTKSLLIIMYDPDAPLGTFYHWILYNVPPDTLEIPEDIPKTPITDYGMQGRNDFGKIGYGGPCPPKGHGSHRYFFVVVALDIELDLPPGASLSDIVNAAKDHVLAYGEYMGVYNR